MEMFAKLHASGVHNGPTNNIYKYIEECPVVNDQVDSGTVHIWTLPLEFTDANMLRLGWKTVSGDMLSKF